jgi:hypothetical protein
MARSVSFGVQEKERTQPEWVILKEPETGRHIGRFNPQTYTLFIVWRGTEIRYQLFENSENKHTG